MDTAAHACRLLFMCGSGVHSLEIELKTSMHDSLLLPSCPPIAKMFPSMDTAAQVQRSVCMCGSDVHSPRSLIFLFYFYLNHNAEK
mmetsp:Transcript_7254/g.9298  ORF Transcript_7254/g.9298 Transcript_7254/m.9298 type:complete len:86 (-) Transcript_7254:210-467(-)